MSQLWCGVRHINTVIFNTVGAAIFCIIFKLMKMLLYFDFIKRMKVLHIYLYTVNVFFIIIIIMLKQLLFRFKFFQV